VPAPSTAARAVVPSLVPSSPVVPVLAPTATVAAPARLVLLSVVVSLRPSPSSSSTSSPIALRTYLAAAALSFDLNATKTSIKVSYTGYISIIS